MHHNKTKNDSFPVGIQAEYLYTANMNNKMLHSVKVK